MILGEAVLDMDVLGLAMARIRSELLDKPNPLHVRIIRSCDPRTVNPRARLPLKRPGPPRCIRRPGQYRSQASVAAASASLHVFTHTCEPSLF